MDFYIMSKDIAAAKWQNDNLEIINEDLLPLFFQYSHDVFKWIKSRAIDSKRPNSRLLKKALHMTAKDDILTVLSVNAATITDNYWIKPINSDLHMQMSDSIMTIAQILPLQGTMIALTGLPTAKYQKLLSLPISEALKSAGS